MSAKSVLLDVMRWTKTGEHSAMGSGPAIVCDGWAKARKLAQKWMDASADNYVSIMPHVPPFSERRALYEQGFDGFCATAGGRCFGYVWLDGALDAHENIAAGSVFPGGPGKSFGKHIVRGWM